jgi:hypothetical protein
MMGATPLGRRIGAAALVGGVSFRPLLALDLAMLQLQPSQRQLGLADITLEMAPAFEAGSSWTALKGGRVLCCAGLHRPFRNWHATAWAMLAEDLGHAHVAITRFARAQIAEYPARRVEAVVRMEVPAEQRWAELVGLRFESDLPGWGPHERGAMLYSRIRS